MSSENGIGSLNPNFHEKKHDENNSVATAIRPRSTARRPAEDVAYPFEVPVLNSVSSDCETRPQNPKLSSKEFGKLTPEPERFPPWNLRSNSLLKSKRVANNEVQQNSLPECSPTKRKRGRPQSQESNDSRKEQASQGGSKANTLMNLLREDQNIGDPDQRRPKTNNTNTESYTMLPNEAPTYYLEEKQPERVDVSENKSSELYKLLTRVQVVEKPSKDKRQPANLSEHASWALQKGYSEVPHTNMHYDQHVIKEKIEIRDCHSTRPKETLDVEKEKYLGDIENSKVLSIKQEYVTQQIEQTTISSPLRYSVKQEPYQLPMSPFEHHHKTETTDIPKAPEQSIKQENTEAQYQVVPLQYPIKNEPYWRELDVTRESPNHSIKQELYQLTRCQATNNLPAMLQQTSAKLELGDNAYQVPHQQPIKAEPYWPQLDVKGIQNKEHRVFQTKAIKEEPQQIDPDKYFKLNHPCDRTKHLKLKEIKRELIREYSPTRLSGMSLGHSNTEVPPWRQSEIRRLNEDLFTNTQPLHLSIKQELQNPIDHPTMAMDQHKHKPSWHRPDARTHNDYGIQVKPLPLLKRDLGEQRKTKSKIPLLPVKQEPFWPEPRVTTGHNRNATGIMMQHETMQQELIRKQHTTTETPLLQVKKEPINQESIVYQQIQNTTQLKPYFATSQELYARPQVPPVTALRINQQHQLHQIKREQNRHQPIFLAADAFGPLQNNRLIMPPTTDYPRVFRQQFFSRPPFQVPGTPVPPLISDIHRIKREISSDSFPTTQREPRLLPPNILAPEYQQGVFMQSRKRSRKHSAQKHGTIETPVIFPVAQDPFWLQQELLRQQRLAASRIMLSTAETHQHQLYQNYTQSDARPEVHLQDSIRQANSIAEDIAEHFLPIPFQNLKTYENRTAKRTFEKAFGYQEQMLQTAPVRPVPPRRPQALPLTPSDSLHQHKLQTPWSQWQPLVSPLAPTTLGSGTTVPNPTRLFDDTLHAQQIQMTIQHQHLHALIRMKQKHQHFAGISGSYHQQENRLNHISDQEDVPGSILQAALAVRNDKPHPIRDL